MAARNNKVHAPKYDLTNLLMAEEKDEYHVGDHVALLTNADDWDHGFRVLEVNERDIVLKKANIIERISTRDAQSRLKTDVSGAMAAYKPMSKSERAELREVFGLFDQDGDGYITPQEISSLLQRLVPAKRYTQSDITNMIARFDSDGNGEIDFDEFLSMMAGQEENHKEVDELRGVFDLFDADNSGTITKQELFEVMKATGEMISMDEVQLMMENVDLDDDGSIDFEEFQKVIMDGPQNDPKFLIRKQNASKKATGEMISMDEVQLMMENVDLDGDGSIDFEEFQKVIMDGPQNDPNPKATRTNTKRASVVR